jgi:hypothetical protein
VVVGGGAAGVAAAETLRDERCTATRTWPRCTANVEEGSVDDGKFVALYRKDGIVTAVLGWNAGGRLPGYRGMLAGAQN